METTQRVPRYIASPKVPTVATVSTTGSLTSGNCGTPKANSSRKATGPAARIRIAVHSNVARRREAPTWRASAQVSSMVYGSISVPPIISTCVGPHSVTSCPNSRCHRSSSGKPSSAKSATAVPTAGPSGTRQVLVIRRVRRGRRSSERARASAPPAKIAISPTKMK